MSSAARTLNAVLLSALAATSLVALPRRTKTPTPTAPTPTTTPAPAAPKPAALVPDQPYVGTPSAGEKSYAAVLRAKQAGATEAELLSRIEKGGVRYSLSTEDIQTLRNAGISAKVIEAMLRSGRTPLPAATPVRTVAATPTLAPR
jgi:hypothetical protein